MVMPVVQAQPPVEEVPSGNLQKDRQADGRRYAYEIAIADPEIFRK